jgi:hypothetical protein
VPTSISIAFANKVAVVGAQASRSAQEAPLPISPAALHQTLNQAFVDALHEMFIIAVIVILIATLLAVFSLQQARVGRSSEATGTLATTEVLVAAAPNER